MSVSACTTPDVLRVSFIVHRDSQLQYEVVCFVQVVDGIVEINYSHHINRNRPVEKGPWHETVNKRDLSPALIAEIEIGVMYELWSQFARKVQPLAPEVVPADLVFAKRQAGKSQ